jgi:aminoglycoside 6-adenylyltransferase
VDQLTVLQQVVAWARGEDNVRAVVLTGSVARGEDAFDELSDLDLELYVTDPAGLLDHDGWYEPFGEVLVVEALQNPGWHPTRLVYYAEGKIDFMVAPIDVLVRGVTYDRPFQLLLDKDNLHAAIRRRPPQHFARPTPSEFFHCVHCFYAAAIMWAKYLARNDPWSAKVRDWDTKKLLLQMLEWDHKARKGWDFDTCHNGTHLREWADPQLLDSIDACWSAISRQDSARALLKSLSLFDALSARTAIALGIRPFDGTRIRQQVAHLLARGYNSSVAESGSTNSGAAAESA